MKLHKDDILISIDREDSSFDHYDRNMNLLERVAIPGFSAGASVQTFAQYQDRLYISAINPSAFPAEVHVIEYNNSLQFVRTVFNGIDASDPAQNPDALDQSTLSLYHITLDSDGNIFTVIGLAYDIIWKYNNNGSFVRYFRDMDTINSNGLAIKPDNNCEIVKFTTTSFGVPDIILRYDVCAATQIETINSTDTSGPLGHSFFGASCVAPKYAIIGTAPDNKLYIFDLNWSLIRNFAVTIPSGHEQPQLGRLVSNGDDIWIAIRFAPLDPNDNRLSLYKLRVLDNTIIVAPIPIGNISPINDMLVWRIAAGCPGGGWISSTLIGAN